MAGDYAKYKHTYADRTTDVQILTGTDDTTAAALISARSASHRLFIQRITVTPTTYAAKTWTFQDSAGTPVPIGVASIPAAAPTAGGDKDFEFDFGPEGVALTTGKNLNLLMSATGAAGMIHIEAYERLAAGAVALAAVGGLTN